jgi:pyruvate dehydrogenase E1 component alpha subunit
MTMIGAWRPSTEQAGRVEWLAQMQRIRLFEKALIRLSLSGQMRGSVHPCTGQEAVSVGVAAALRDDDMIFFTYRGHGHALAKGLPLVDAFAEVFGRSTGSNRGYGGSMLLADYTRGVMGGNSIVAGSVPTAVGRAFAVQHNGGDQVVVSCFGDGATNQGAWHEAMVLAAMWQVPAVFVCENNEYSEMTPIAETVPLVPNLADRGAAYGIPGRVVDGADVDEVHRAAVEAVQRARSGGGPTLLEMKCFRLDGHFVSDDQRYIPKERREEWARRDPLVTFRARLQSEEVPAQVLLELDARVDAEVEAAIAEARSAPYPDPAQLAEVPA